MNYSFHPEADEELHKAYEYYEAQRQGLGQRFGEAFDEALASVLDRRISVMPLLFPALS